MGLLSRMIENGEEWYRMGNLYIGYVCTNVDVEDLNDDECSVSYIKQGPIICYKPTFSKVYTRVSNDVEYLENTWENNSLEVGDSYFQITGSFVNFVREYLVNFDKATKIDHLGKRNIIKLEDLIMEQGLEIQSKGEQEQIKNK